MRSQYKTRVWFRSILFILLTLALGSHAFGATVTAANTSGPAVQAAINSAADGDTVMVPAGSSTWTSQITAAGKGINLVGAGIDRTIITYGMANNNAMLMVDNLGNKRFTLSGFTFADGGGAYNGIVGVGGANWR